MIGSGRMEETSKKDKDIVNSIPAMVAAVISARRVVINKGASDGIKHSQRFIIYQVSAEEIIDPITKESLGRLETYKGAGKVVHIQERMSVLDCDSPGGYGPRSASLATLSEIMAGHSTPPEFDNPKIGDKARPI
jgi:hypothetical protein